MGPRADAEVWVDLARMRILAAAGYVSPEAEDALRQALTIDPTQGDARFLLGAMYQRQDRPDLAFVIWRNLLADSTAGAPWVPPILDQIEEVAFFAGQRIDLSAIAPGGLRGPSQDQIDAAAEMSIEERMAMIEGMVASLNDRLATEGGSAEDWARLIGAYGVLGNLEAARAILAEAREVFADDAAAQALFDQAEAGLPPE
jgi:cytochrome c-type biogenesis protein CcmH